jgi:hypothetical protein
MDHPGLGNSYFAKSKHMITQTVNDMSILEHYHCYKLVKIIEESEILAHFSYKGYLETITSVRDIILSTDMTKHFKLMKSKHFEGLHEGTEIKVE